MRFRRHPVRAIYSSNLTEKAATPAPYSFSLPFYPPPPLSSSMTATSGGQRCTQRKESQWRRPYFCCLSCYTKAGVVYASALEELGMVGRNLSAGRPELLGRSASIAGKNVARGGSPKRTSFSAQPENHSGVVPQRPPSFSLSRSDCFLRC